LIVSIGGTFAEMSRKDGDEQYWKLVIDNIMEIANV